MAMKEKSFLGLGPAGFHRVAYTEWGEESADRVCICVHGLTRNSRDYDLFAGTLQRDCRVVCPDVVGRGESDWLDDPAQYDFPQYVNDMAGLIARVDRPAVDWVGTSMGGIIGMAAAAQKNSPIARLVLVDIGPFIPKASLERIGGNVGNDNRFADVAAAEAYFRTVSAPFGPLSDAHWRHIAEHGTRPDGAGALRLHYDPRIAARFGEGAATDVDLWHLWDAIRCPVLVVRGAESDLLLKETADEMTRRGPKATVIEVADTGHAPMLMDDPTIEAVRSWLINCKVV